MMYNQKMVASIKVKGKILREFNDTVYIPYGSEYSLLLKNLNTVRSIVNIFIDGTNVVPGGLVINQGQEIDQERSIANNNLNEGNRFKFIERTGNIEDHRGIKVEDGLVRVEYQFEKVYTQPSIDWSKTLYNQRPDPFYRKWDSGTASPGILRSMSISSTLSSSEPQIINQVTAQAASYNDIGITVPGSKSEQKFTSTSWFATEIEKHNIILKLLGETPDNEIIRNPITVKSKPKCVTCGKQNKATAKFCAECGTSLKLFA